MKKIRIGILFGGKSAEHEVSLQSAKNIIEAIDRDKYEIVLIGIDKKGKWYLNRSSHFLLHADDPKMISIRQSKQSLALVPGAESEKILAVSGDDSIGSMDVVFPVLHGPYGEDGTVQGVLKLSDIPFVGSGVLGSAVSMDKDVMKRLLNQSGIPQAKFISYRFYDKSVITYEEIKSITGIPCFVKPANLGSSVGISKVHNRDEFKPAVEKAFEYDDKIIIEEYIRGREIECAVLGNEKPVASVPGEVIPCHEYYSYDAKYLDEHGANFKIPAELSGQMTKTVQNLAIKCFKILNCDGMARVDFFLGEDDKLLVNELNTIPGFTKISMYPKLWEASGVSYPELIDRLINLAIQKHQRGNIQAK